MLGVSLGAWLYGVHRTRRDGSSYTWHRDRVTAKQRCKYTISVDTEKRSVKSYSHSFRIICDKSAVSVLERGE